MITTNQIKALIDEHFAGSDLFLVDVITRTGNRISVFIDGDQGVSIDACRSLNRYLEEILDREKEDFDLTVSSAGADRPLILPRQYKKNAGKELEIDTVDGEKFNCTLLNVNDHGIEVEQSIRRSKKETEKKIRVLTFEEIKTAKEIISFKK